MGEGRGQELHRASGPRRIRCTATRVAAVVGLDPPDRRQDFPVEPEPRRGVFVQDEVVGRDIGDVGRSGERGCRDRRPAGGKGARDAGDHHCDERHDETPAAARGAAARAAGAPGGHPVSGGAYL